jgi:glucokinase
MTDVFLALEIGGTKLQAVLGFMSDGGTLVRRGAAPSEGGAEAILNWFIQPVRELIDEAGARDCAVRRIAIGFGGPIDSERGIVLVSHQVQGWDGFELKKWAQEHFGIETCVYNDSSAAAWGEYVAGAGRGTKTFLYSNIGSGIGGGLVIDGRLHDGQGLGAAEVGHTYVPDWTNGGTARKLEDLCSGWAIERRLRSGREFEAGSPLAELSAQCPDNITCSMLGEAARRGDEAALEELEHVGQCIGLALANVITLVHPEKVALGGGVSLMGDVLLDPVRRWAHHYVFGPFRGRFSIIPCELGESVVTLGALYLAGAPVRG